LLVTILQIVYIYVCGCHYIDAHTQLWINPKEEILQYVDIGDPIDVTFSVKELKVW